MPFSVGYEKIMHSSSRRGRSSFHITEIEYTSVTPRLDNSTMFLINNTNNNSNKLHSIPIGAVLKRNETFESSRERSLHDLPRFTQVRLLLCFNYLR